MSGFFFLGILLTPDDGRLRLARVGQPAGHPAVAEFKDCRTGSSGSSRNVVEPALEPWNPNHQFESLRSGSTRTARMAGSRQPSSVISTSQRHRAGEHCRIGGADAGQHRLQRSAGREGERRRRRRRRRRPAARHAASPWRRFRPTGRRAPSAGQSPASGSRRQTPAGRGCRCPASRNEIAAKPASTRTWTRRAAVSDSTIVGQHANVGDRLLRVGARDDLAHCRRQRGGRDGRADDEILGSVEDQSAVGHLARGQVDLRLALAFEPAHRMLPTTPTTVRSRNAMKNCRPIGSWSGQIWSANDWLTTATQGASRVSASATSRPRRSGMPVVEKNPGVTKRRLAIRVSVGSGAQLDRASSLKRPKSRMTGQIPPRMVIGRKLIYDAFVTPGSARVSFEHAIVELLPPLGGVVLRRWQRRSHASGRSRREIPGRSAARARARARGGRTTPAGRPTR